VVFDRVSFAFDDHVVLQDISFTVPKGTMKVLLGASGAGKSTILKLILGLLRPDAGAIHVNGQRVDQMREADLRTLRGDIGMSFQELALFDSLTVGENVGYRLETELHLPADEVQTRVEEVLGFVGLGEYVDRMPTQLSGGTAPARGHRPRDGFQAQSAAVRRSHHGPRPDRGHQRRRRDHQAAGSRARHVDLRHPPDS
jgi:phospholipid/cholesterol/gamma-HCH transport system ATP-binding protein